MLTGGSDNSAVRYGQTGIRAWLWLLLLMLPLIAVRVIAAEELLTALSTKAEKLDSMAGTFTQEYKISVLPLPLISEGDFHYRRQTGMVWTTRKPIQSRLTINRNGVYMEDAGADRPALSQPQLGETLLALISGDLQTLTALFEITATGSVDDWHLHLVPRNALVAAQIDAIDISGRDVVQSVTIDDASGDNTRIHFTTLEKSFLND